MTERRQLTENDKEKVLEIHGRVCFIDGAPIPEDETAEFHHINPWSRGGPTTLDNIAPVCSTHHRTIGTMSLQESRDKIELGTFFEGDPKYLDDVIAARNMTAGEKLNYTIAADVITLYFENSQHEYPLYELSLIHI